MSSDVLELVTGIIRLKRGCQATCLNLETGQLFRHYIAEISLNVLLQQTKPVVSLWTDLEARKCEVRH